MRVTWNSILSTGRSEPLLLPSLAWPVELVVHPRARSMRLRLDERHTRLVLTVPRGTSRRTALGWAERQAPWVERQLQQIGPGEPFCPGGSIPLAGSELILEWDAALPRTPAISGNSLRCGGPIEAFPQRVERFLRSAARERLSEESAKMAEAAGVTIRSVSVGDARSRWGSCSASGALRYNWRIILAPPHLLRWLVAHEVAHRRHMDHGPGFKQLEARLYGGDIASARAELRSIGPRLKRVGRGN